MNAALYIPVKTLPASLVSPKFRSDDDFEALCHANDLFRLERTKEGEVLVHAPTGGSGSDGNAEIVWQLRSWWNEHERGRMFDSNCGFFLPDGSMLNPDAAYVLPEKLKGLDKRSIAKFLRLSPDFVVELLSPTDRLKPSQAKMESWIENGARLGWLIDPYKKRVFVYQPGVPVVCVTASAVQGSGPVEGFTLDLGRIWRCYEI
jgi:Uma2 family endonuclease